MAHHVLGRSIQSTYLFISHVNALYRPLPPLICLSPPSNVSSKKQQWSSSAFRSLLSTSAFQRPVALSQHKTQPFVSQEEEGDYKDEEDDESEGGDHEEEENNEEFNEESKVVVSSGEQKQVTNPARRIPELTVKEKKQLSAYAHSLGKKLKCHQVGKSGVTSSVEVSVSDALEANELIKLKVHNTCPDELDVVASRLQETTRSVVVGQIGRTFILYRPSLRKVPTAEEKKPPQRSQRRSIAKSAGWKNRPT